MKKLGMTVIAGTLAAALSGCYFVSEEIAKTAAMSPSGSAFSQSLHKYYVEEAKIALAESDHQHADIYQMKGRLAAGGAEPEPEMLGLFDWWVPNRSRASLEDARARLMTALGDGHKESHPDQLARAQTYFDCWVEEEHEDIWWRSAATSGHAPYQPDDLNRCKDGFERAMQFDQKAMSYIVYFNFDKSNIRSPDAVATMDQVVAAAKAGVSTRVAIFAHTDTAGSKAYNVGLSKRRASSVMGYLTSRGIDASRITATWFGETKLACPTPDGTPNQCNRRAEITIQ